MATAWDRQDGESETCYEYFLAYLRDERRPREIRRLSRELGRSDTLFYAIAKEWDWRERARQYDNFVTAPTLEIRQATITEFADALNQNLQQKLAAVEGIASEELRKLRDRQANGEDVDLLNLKRLIGVIGDADTLARRSAGLPTVFTRDKTTRDSSDEETYYVVSDN